MPAGLDEQLALTADLVRQRMSMGDRADVPREVNHSAIFRRKADARAAAEELEALGYKVEFRRRWLNTLLEFNHTTAVDHDSSAAFTREVLYVVERHEGEYDGWGAFLEQ